MHGIIQTFTKVHYYYDGDDNPIYTFKTDDEHGAVGGDGMCQVEKREFNALNDVINVFIFYSNDWDSAWNLTSDVVLP